MLFNARRDLLAKPVGEELILYDPTSEGIHTLNMTAATIFRLCDGRNTQKDIAKALVESFDSVELTKASSDVKRTLDILKTKQLVVSVEPAASSLSEPIKQTP